MADERPITTRRLQLDQSEILQTEGWTLAEHTEPTGIDAPEPMMTAISTATPEWPSDSGPSSYVRPDVLILDNVVQVLAWDPYVLSVGIDVSCESGVVSIGGDVGSPDMRDRIEMLITSRVLGVTGVTFAVESTSSEFPARALLGHQYPDLDTRGAGGSA